MNVTIGSKIWRFVQKKWAQQKWWLFSPKKKKCEQHIFTFTKTFENSFETNFCLVLKQINEITRNASLTITKLILVNPQIKSDQKQNHFSLLQLNYDVSTSTFFFTNHFIHFLLPISLRYSISLLSTYLMVTRSSLIRKWNH